MEKSRLQVSTNSDNTTFFVEMKKKYETRITTFKDKETKVQAEIKNSQTRSWYHLTHP